MTVLTSGTPVVIVDGYHVVLKKANHLTPDEDGCLSIWVEDIEGGVVVKDLIHRVIVDLVPEAQRVSRILRRLIANSTGLFRRGASRRGRSQFKERVGQDRWDVRGYYSSENLGLSS